MQAGRLKAIRMEAALLVLATKAGLQTAATRQRFRRLDEIPFDARHRYMATLHTAIRN